MHPSAFATLTDFALEYTEVLQLHHTLPTVINCNTFD